MLSKLDKIKHTDYATCSGGAGHMFIKENALSIINQLIDTVNALKEDWDSLICDYSERRRTYEGQLAQLYDCLNACRNELRKAGLSTDNTYPSYIDKQFVPSINDLVLKATFCVPKDTKLSIFLKELENLAKYYGVFLTTYSLEALGEENSEMQNPLKRDKA